MDIALALEFLVLIGFTCAFLETDRQKVLLKSVYFFFVIFTLFSIFNYIVFLKSYIIFTIEVLFELYLAINKYKSLNVKSAELNNLNVFILSYKPKIIYNKGIYTFIKSLNGFFIAQFGLPYSSAALYINGKLYRLKRDKKTLQEEIRSEAYIYHNYLVVDTKFNHKNLVGDWRGELLKQKARIKRFFWLRYTCLYVLRPVINQIQGFEFKGLLPSIYLKKVARFEKNGK